MSYSPKFREMRYTCQIGNCYRLPRNCSTWDDLIDHMLNEHMIVIHDNKLMHYNRALGIAGELESRGH